MDILPGSLCCSTRVVARSRYWIPGARATTFPVAFSYPDTWRGDVFFLAAHQPHIARPQNFGIFEARKLQRKVIGLPNKQPKALTVPGAHSRLRTDKDSRGPAVDGLDQRRLPLGRALRTPLSPRGRGDVPLNGSFWITPQTTDTVTVRRESSRASAEGG